MKQYQLSVRNYSQQNEDAIDFIVEEFESLDDAEQHVRENLLGNYDFTEYGSYSELLDCDRKIQHHTETESKALNYPIYLRDDDLLLGEKNEFPDIFDLASANENYCRIYDLADLDIVKNFIEETDFFDTDSQGVLSITPNQEQRDFETALFENLAFVFNFSYHIALDPNRRVYFSDAGLGDYIDSVIFSDTAIEDLQSVYEAFSEQCNNAEWLCLASNNDSDIAIAKKMMISSDEFNPKMTKEQFKAFTLDDSQVFIRVEDGRIYTSMNDAIKDAVKELIQPKIDDFQVINFGGGEGQIRAQVVLGTNLISQAFIEKFCVKNNIYFADGAAFGCSLSDLIEQLEKNKKQEMWSVYTNEIFAEEKFLGEKDGDETADYRIIKIQNSYVFDFFTEKGMSFSSTIKEENRTYCINGVVFIGKDDVFTEFVESTLGMPLDSPSSVFNVSDYSEKLDKLKERGYQWEQTPEYQPNTALNM